MAETVASVLTPWSNFYIMTGSSASALTGLMFVVITLVTNVERTRRSSDGISTFSTPTVVHFSAVLLASALLCAPWRSLIHPATLLGLAGLSGVVYVFSLMYRTKRLTLYSADLEDWAWYTVLPLVAYGTILGGAVVLPAAPVHGLFAVAAGVLLLIFTGIHNAWDIVTFLVIRGPDEPPSST
jgi:hypothetical protein